MFVKPAPGLVIRDPELLDLLPAEGREVSDDNMYWQRRVRDRDVVIVTSTQAPAVVTPAVADRSEKS